MAIAFVSSGSENFAATDPWSVDGVASPGSDYIVLIIAGSGEFTIDSVPSGFTLIKSQVETADYQVEVYGGFAPTAPYSVGFTGAEAGTAGWLRYSGVNTGTPVDVAGVGELSGGASTIIDTPPITPVTAGARIIGIAGIATLSAATSTFDAGHGDTERLEAQNTTQGSGCYVGDRTWGGSGAEDVQGDISISRVTCRITIALRPAAFEKTGIAISAGVVSGVSESTGSDPTDPVILLSSLATTTGTGPYTTNSMTPYSGSMLAVFVALPAHTTFGQATVTDSIGEVTFTRFSSQPRFDANGDASNGSLYFFLADNPAAAKSRTLEIGCGSDPAEGCVAAVIQINGMTKGGTAGILQSQIQNLSAAGGTPSMVLPGTPSSTNVILGAVANRDNPATLSPNVDYEELLDTGIATPNTGLQVMARASGETSSGVTWGSVSTTAKACFLIELDMTSADPMPTEDVDDFRLIFSDDFTTDCESWGVCTAYGTGVPPDRMCDGLGPEYEDKFWAYTTAYPDTREQQSADGGYYNPAAMSMTQSYLKMILSRTGGTTSACAFVPKVFGSNAPAHQTFGRYAIRWWSESDPDLKVAWLLYRQEDDWGETDYPEADLNSQLQSFVHLNPYPGQGDPQLTFDSGVDFAGEWHTAIVEWRPDSWKFYLDGALINTEEGVDAHYGENIVTQYPMSWVLQCETRMGGAAPPATIAPTAILVDWVAVWEYTGEPEPEPYVPQDTGGRKGVNVMPARWR